MGRKLVTFHQPIFNRSVEVARPLKSDPPFSAIPHLDPGAEKWNCVTSEAITEETITELLIVVFKIFSDPGWYAILLLILIVLLVGNAPEECHSVTLP